MTPIEYSPEITEDFYNKLARPIAQRGAERQGQARSEALARGLTGDPIEGSLVGAARAQTDTDLNDLNANVNFDLAGKAREERLTKEGQQFSAGESALDRSLQERLTRLGYEMQGNFQQNEMNAKKRALPYELAAGVGGAALGAMKFSDRRLKRDVERIGSLNGLSLYSFKYKTEEYPHLDLPAGEQTGFMADEVEVIMPAAIRMRDGFKMVDYAMAAGAL